MKKYIIMLSLLIGCNIVFAEQIKNLAPTGFVNDYANIFTTSQEQALETKLTTIASEGKAEIAVVTINTLDGQDIESYAIEVASMWGIGKKGKDNGVLILTAIKDRDLRIEVGYGLEGDLNDSKCGRIMDNYIIPQFKSGDYASGIIAGVDAIIKEIKTPTITPVKSNDNQTIFIVFVIIGVLFIILIIIAGIYTSNKSVYTSLPRSYIPPNAYTPRSRPYTPSTQPYTPRARPTSKSNKSSPSYKPSNSFGSGGFKGFGGGSFGGGGSSRKW